MAVNKVVLGDQTLIDLTADSVTPDKLFKGITAHNMKGESIVGTMEGGSTPSEPSDNTAVIFADYDGNLIDTWTKDEVASKTTLPTPPAHSGLVFEGWNWTLEDIQTDTTGQVITVGPFYHTESGLTEIDIHLDKYNGKTFGTINGSRVDWGDGTVTTGQNRHTYENYGDYTVTIEGTIADISYSEDLGNGSSQSGTSAYFITGIRCSGNLNSIYVLFQKNIGYVTLNKSIKTVNIDSKIANVPQLTVPIDSKWNGNCYQTPYFAMAKRCAVNTNLSPRYGIDYSNNKSKYLYLLSDNGGIDKIGNNAFSNCSSLKSITIPSNVTSIGSSAFNGCSSLQSITIPESVTSIGSNAFSGCSSLKSITIPSSVTSIISNTFSGCSSLQSITFPSSVTSIGDSAFNGCSSLQSITIPESVTSIGAYAFSGCTCKYAVINSTSEIKSSTYRFSVRTSYDFSECESVPVLSSSNSLQDVLWVNSIYVPLSLYYEWKQATNWAAYASKIQPKGEGIVAFNGVGKLTYNEATTLNAQYVSDTEPTNITITASNPDALEIGQYTIDNTAKTITIPVTAKSVTDTVTVTLSATFKDGVKSETLSIKIKESFKAPSFTVTDVEGASYNFVLNDAGYYESTNKGVANSAALCKLDITDLEDTTRVIFDCINSGEANYDYGMISKINTTLGTTNSEDSASNLFVSFKGQSSTNVVTKSYPIDNVAACFFTLKFRKDSGGDQGNDSLQFKVRFE